jgi:hypothetical protein
MVESGNYLYPTFNGRLRPDKPILIYWLMSMPLRVLGPTSLACRFFGAVGVATACVFTFLIGRRFLGMKAALWSMVILASTVMVVVIGTAATSDAVLLPAMVAVMLLFTHAITSGLPWYYVPAMGLALGLGLLAKGPVALLPIPAIGATLWLGRRRAIAAAVRDRTGGAVPVRTFEYSEPSLRFYVGRRIEPLRGEDELLRWVREPQPGVLVIPTDILAEIEQRDGSLGLEEIATKRGLNLAKGKPLEVVVLLRGGRNP